jgi:hypothetical protein
MFFSALFTISTPGRHKLFSSYGNLEGYYGPNGSIKKERENTAHPRI